MGNFKSPITTFLLKKGEAKAGLSKHKVLIIAQGGGKSKFKKVAENIQIGEVNEIFGANSMVTMAFNRFRKHNKESEIDIIPLEVPSDGVKASGGINVIGTATENKTLTLHIGDDEFKVDVAILKDDTAEQIVVKITDAINDTDMPFKAKINNNFRTTAKVGFKIAGEVGNGLVIVAKNKIFGCEFNPIKFTGGVGVYDTTDIFVGINERYQTVLFDSCIKFDQVEEWLESRFNMQNTVKGGSGFVMINGDITSLTDFAKTKDSKTMTVFGNLDEMKYNAIPLLAMAEFGAKRALRLTEGAVISHLVTESVESYGGVEKSSLPYHNTPMDYERPKGELGAGEFTNLQGYGVNLFISDNYKIMLSDVTTLMKSSSEFKYLNAVDTSLAIQEYLFKNCKKKFSQTRATKGPLIKNIAMSNILSVKGYIIELYENLIEMALVDGREEVFDEMKEKLTVTLTAEKGTFDIFAPVVIVSQLRVINGIIEINYSF